MFARKMVTALASAAVIAGAVGCGTSSAPNATSSPAEPPSPYVTMDLTIDKGTVTPTNARLQAKVGQPIVARVTTDEYDDLHIGSSPDLRFGVDPRARAPQVFQFTIDAPGQVEVTLLS